MESIAIIIDQKGLSSTFFDGNLLNVYKKSEDTWDWAQSFPLELSPEKGLTAVREYIAEIIGELGNCKVIAGRNISGIPYNILDAAGFSIFQIEGSSEAIPEIIDEVLSHDAEHSNEDSSDEVIPAPQQTDDGIYLINLQQVQINHPKVSSKQILLPFLKGQNFYKLTVMCSHVPPWFDTQLDKLGLKKEIEQLDVNLYKVVIYHKTCDEK